MPTCDYCAMPFDLFDGIYDDGDFMCGSCIAGFIIKSEAIQDNSRQQLEPKPSHKTEKQKKCQTVSPSHSSQVSGEQNTSKLDKAGRLAKNIQIMLKSKGGSLCINPSNKKAFELAVERLGMKLDQFHINDDDFYLQISLKRDIQKDTRTVPALLKRPELPKNNTTKLQ
ncbi:hypothetical protein [Nostoc sp. DedSLP04]|uniref:hypothetical protein n=1 Tax=Nostoc sp. DedSLP04 TaxID=3075401 RepID=UPI002AD24A6A|nr:hypothetical protein [Nostoc sp. DedSLP04]